MKRVLLAGAVLLGACHRPPRAPAATTTLELRLVDAATRQPIAGRVLLLDAAGQPVHLGTIDLYDKRQGASAVALAVDALGSWDGVIVGRGTASVPIGVPIAGTSAIPYGRYRAMAWYGIEYDRAEAEVELGQGGGAVVLELALHRVFAPAGTLAADMHVHAQGSPDSTTPYPWRVLTQLSAGIQVVGISDHDTNASAAEAIAALGLGDRIAAVASDEVSPDSGHLGVYPVVVEPGRPQGGAPTVAEIVGATVVGGLGIAHNRFGQGVIIQVNHPRFRVTAAFDAVGWNGVVWPPPFPLTFDALEVLNGHTAFNEPDDRRIDQTANDFYTFTDHGFLVAPMGNSDVHHFNGVHDGVARTYVFVGAAGADVAHFDQAAFIDAIRRRRTEATTGPWLDVVAHGADAAVTAGPGQGLAATGSVTVDITLAQANFVHADAIHVRVGTSAGPVLYATLPVDPHAPTQHVSTTVPVGSADTWIGIEASGTEALPLEQTGTYQREKGRRGVTPFAIISPILIDADRDGRWRRGDTELPLADLRR